MNNIRKASEDFAISVTGEAFISQREVARMCGVNLNAIQYHIKKQSIGHLTTNENNNLDEKSCVLLVTHFCKKGNIQALKTSAKLMEAGVRAYVYTCVGSETQAIKLKQQVKQLESKLKVEQSKPPKTIGVSSKKNRLSLHMQREELFDLGFCDRWIEEVKHYYYPVNDLGRAEGYRNTGKGKYKTIDLGE